MLSTTVYGLSVLSVLIYYFALCDKILREVAQPMMGIGQMVMFPAQRTGSTRPDSGSITPRSALDTPEPDPVIEEEMR
jgi:hypothetical protein